MRNSRSGQVKQCLKHWWSKLSSCCREEVEESRQFEIGSPFNFRHEGGANMLPSGVASTDISACLLPRAATPTKDPHVRVYANSLQQSESEHFASTPHDFPSTRSSSLNFSNMSTAYKDGDSITLGTEMSHDSDKTLDK